jgi:uncharacterized protein (TIGR02246 family)
MRLLPESPQDIAETFVDAWNARDATRLASVFAEDAEFVNVVGLWWHDRASIEKAHAYGLERIFQNSTLHLIRTKTNHLSDDIAVVHAKMRLTDQTSIGDVDAPGIRQNIFTFVARRTASGWECVAAHNTDIVPGAETNLVDSDGRMRSVTYR